MKNIIIVSFALLALMACGGNDSKEKKEGTTEEKKDASDVSQNPDYQKGLAAVGKSNCLTCHKIDEALTGPPYRDVANKYAGVDTAVKYLADKIIRGGSGVWGQVPMIPHPEISEEEAQAMAKYILLLKNK